MNIQKAQVNINSQEFLDKLPENTRKVHIIANSDVDTLTKLNPWKLEKAINKIAGKLEAVDYLKSGALMATCKSFIQVKTLLKTTEIGFEDGKTIHVSVTIALAGQTTLGKVYIPQISGAPLHEILQRLEPQGVINI